MKTLFALVLVGSLAGMAVMTARARGGLAGERTPFPDPAVDDALASARSEASMVVAGGCFWGVQAVFQHLKGVVSATSGYSGGAVKNPSYEVVSSGTSGHAESVKVIYDPSQITYGQLLKVFFSVAHDPTELNVPPFSSPATTSSASPRRTSIS
jgi:peptide-methionine (S)-S-oxide reductase